MSLRILLADASRPMRQLVSRFLLAAGAGKPTEARSGSEALKLAQSELFDLIVLDWAIPGISGADLVQQLRRAQAQDDPKVSCHELRARPHDVEHGSQSAEFESI
jgi:DNA-binding response OmpR family regulator